MKDPGGREGNHFFLQLGFLGLLALQIVEEEGPIGLCFCPAKEGAFTFGVPASGHNAISDAKARAPKEETRDQ